MADSGCAKYAEFARSIISSLDLLDDKCFRFPHPTIPAVVAPSSYDGRRASLSASLKERLVEDQIIIRQSPEKYKSGYHKELYEMHPSVQVEDYDGIILSHWVNQFISSPEYCMDVDEAMKELEVYFESKESSADAKGGVAGHQANTSSAPEVKEKPRWVEPNPVPNTLPPPPRHASTKTKGMGLKPGLKRKRSTGLVLPVAPLVKEDREPPWLQLTALEMAQLRRRMRKNSTWTFSDAVIARELEDLGRGIQAYQEAQAAAEAEGKRIEEPPQIRGKKVNAEGALSVQAVKDAIEKGDPHITNKGMVLAQATRELREKSRNQEQPKGFPKPTSNAMETSEGGISDAKVEDSGYLTQSESASPKPIGEAHGNYPSSSDMASFITSYDKIDTTNAFVGWTRSARASVEKELDLEQPIDLLSFHKSTRSIPAPASSPESARERDTLSPPPESERQSKHPDLTATTKPTSPSATAPKRQAFDTPMGSPEDTDRAKRMRLRSDKEDADVDLGTPSYSLRSHSKPSDQSTATAKPAEPSTTAGNHRSSNIYSLLKTPTPSKPTASSKPTENTPKTAKRTRRPRVYRPEVHDEAKEKSPDESKANIVRDAPSPSQDQPTHRIERAAATQPSGMTESHSTTTLPSINHQNLCSELPYSPSYKCLHPTCQRSFTFERVRDSHMADHHDTYSGSSNTPLGKTGENHPAKGIRQPEDEIQKVVVSLPAQLGNVSTDLLEGSETTEEYVHRVLSETLVKFQEEEKSRLAGKSSKITTSENNGKSLEERISKLERERAQIEALENTGKSLVSRISNLEKGASKETGQNDAKLASIPPTHSHSEKIQGFETGDKSLIQRVEKLERVGKDAERDWERVKRLEEMNEDMRVFDAVTKMAINFVQHKVKIKGLEEKDGDLQTRIEKLEKDMEGDLSRVDKSLVERIKKLEKSAGTEKVESGRNDISDVLLDDLDADLKQKVIRIRMMFPSVSVGLARDAILHMAGSVEGATVLFANSDEPSKAKIPPAVTSAEKSTVENATSEPPKKRRRYKSGGPGGGGRWVEEDEPKIPAGTGPSKSVSVDVRALRSKHDAAPKQNDTVASASNTPKGGNLSDIYALLASLKTEISTQSKSILELQSTNKVQQKLIESQNSKILDLEIKLKTEAESRKKVSEEVSGVGKRQEELEEEVKRKVKRLEKADEKLSDSAAWTKGRFELKIAALEAEVGRKGKVGGLEEAGDV